MSLVRKEFLIGNQSLLTCWVFVVRQKNGNDEYWFCGTDVADFLDFENSSQALKDNVRKEWQRDWDELISVCAPDSHIVAPKNWKPHTIFINEPGLYTLLGRSNKPEALDFTKWLHEKLLPELRLQTGRNTRPPTAEELTLQLQLKDQEIALARERERTKEKELACKEKDVELAQEREANARKDAMVARFMADSLRRDCEHAIDQQQALKRACRRRDDLLHEWQERVVPPLENEDKHECLVLFQHGKNSRSAAIARVQLASIERKKTEMQRSDYHAYKQWIEVPSAQKLWLATRQRLGAYKLFGLHHDSPMRFKLLDSEEIAKKYENYMYLYENRHNNDDERVQKSRRAGKSRFVVEVVEQLQKLQIQEENGERSNESRPITITDGFATKCYIESLEELVQHIDELYNESTDDLSRATRHGEDINHITSNLSIDYDEMIVCEIEPSNYSDDDEDDNGYLEPSIRIEEV